MPERKHNSLLYSSPLSDWFTVFTLYDMIWPGSQRYTSAFNEGNIYVENEWMACFLGKIGYIFGETRH
jgi:hypothetical protein